MRSPAFSDFYPYKDLGIRSFILLHGNKPIAGRFNTHIPRTMNLKQGMTVGIRRHAGIRDHQERQLN